MHNELDNLLRLINQVRAENYLPTGVTVSSYDFTAITNALGIDFTSGGPMQGGYFYLHGIKIIRDEKLDKGAVMIAAVPWRN